MATMRPLLQRVELSWIGLWIVGALCGVLLMVGIQTLRQPSHTAIVPPAAVTVPGATSVPDGGRLGGITSSDTANDAQIRQGVSTGPAASGNLDLPRLDEMTYYRNASTDAPPPYDLHHAGPQ